MSFLCAIVVALVMREKKIEGMLTFVRCLLVFLFFLRQIKRKMLKACILHSTYTARQQLTLECLKGGKVSVKHIFLFGIGNTPCDIVFSLSGIPPMPA